MLSTCLALIGSGWGFYLPFLSDMLPWVSKGRGIPHDDGGGAFPYWLHVISWVERVSALIGWSSFVMIWGRCSTCCPSTEIPRVRKVELFPVDFCECVHMLAGQKDFSCQMGRVIRALCDPYKCICIFLRGWFIVILMNICILFKGDFFPYL